MFAGSPPPKFPGNRPTKDESSIFEWNKNMNYYSRYLIDLLCVPWLEKSSPLFERSTSGFCSLINKWNKNQQLLLNVNVFVFCPNLYPQLQRAPRELPESSQRAPRELPEIS
jgi:hypothetical protein